MTKRMRRLVLCGSSPGSHAILRVVETNHKDYQQHAKTLADYAYGNLAGGFMDAFFEEYLKLSPYVRARTLKVLAAYMGPS